MGQLLSLRRKVLSSVQCASLRQSDSVLLGTQGPVKGRLASFNPTHLSFDDTSEKDSDFEDLNLKEGDCLEGEKPDQPIKNGLAGNAISATFHGIYKGILLGSAGNSPSRKLLRNGSTVTMFTLGTSGMRNNRKPFENETPVQYARRSFVQWHRVAIYKSRLGALAMKSVKKGSQVYVEGNIETRVFLDPESNSIKRIQEVAVRENGRVIFLDENKKQT